MVTEIEVNEWLVENGLLSPAEYAMTLKLSIEAHKKESKKVDKVTTRIEKLKKQSELITMEQLGKELNIDHFPTLEDVSDYTGVPYNTVNTLYPKSVKQLLRYGLREVKREKFIGREVIEDFKKGGNNGTN